jgi:DNA-binding MarR family transcriptional regulator
MYLRGRQMVPSVSTPLTTILHYLAETHTANAEAEVSGPELQHELKLDAATVKQSVAELARHGLAESDPLLSNVWVRITDKGLMAVTRGFSG